MSLPANSGEKSPSSSLDSSNEKAGRPAIESSDPESPSKGIAALSTKFSNPLADVPREQLLRDVESFCEQHKLTTYLTSFQHGALAAQKPSHAAELPDLTAEEQAALLRERTHKWDQRPMLYWLVTMCSLAAAVQGMDETVNNGAQSLYTRGSELNITGTRFGSDKKASLILGLVVSAPYLACAVLGCWLTEPLNALFARRGTIFISCAVAAIASVWEGVVQSWANLFIARFVLGLGIGAKSTTVPVYAAECAPAPIRGAMVMMWQVWTAFGIMLGNIMGVAFGGLAVDLGWRLMLGSTVVLPLVVCAQVWFCPESPRWLIQKGRVGDAFKSFQRLRPTDLQAARDLYYTYANVQLERRATRNKNLFIQFTELFTVPRNRRATLASWIVMFMQQFCGVNIIAYYSTTIFTNSGYSTNSALLASMGTGILNFVFALPAFFTIDTWGRRSLLLFTFPFLAFFLLWTGLSFFLPDPSLIQNSGSKSRIAMVTTGMYLFEVFYSPGEGPVPFTYSAEAFPLHVRDVGMSFATATTWCFSFVISFTWPLLYEAITNQGGFGFYAAWNIVGWVGVLFFVPETKALTLEELDQVFETPTRKHAAYQLRNAWRGIERWVLRRKKEPLQPFYLGKDELVES